MRASVSLVPLHVPLQKLKAEAASVCLIYFLSA